MLAGLCAVGEARADIAPAIPGVGWAYPTYRIETREPHPDYLFVLWYDEFASGRDRAEYVELAPQRPVTFKTGYHSTCGLIIIARSTAAAYSTPTELAQAVGRGEVAGVREHQFPFRVEVPSWTRTPVTLTYRVEPSRSGAGLEIVQTSWDPLWQWYVAAVGLTVAMVLGGCWLLRRKRRKLSTGDAR